MFDSVGYKVLRHDGVCYREDGEVERGGERWGEGRGVAAHPGTLGANKSHITFIIDSLYTGLAVNQKCSLLRK